MSQKKFPKISIIILNYNSGNLLLDCVESVLSSDYENLQVILIVEMMNQQAGAHQP